MSSSPRVASVTVTRRRAPVLKRLLDSLAGAGGLLAEVIVVSDGRDAETEEVVRGCAKPNRYLTLDGETGQGAGMAIGLTAAAQNVATTHFLVVDDDAVVPPETIPILIDEMQRHQAGCAVPLLENEKGEIGWFPGVSDRARWQVLRRPGLTREQFLAECGDASVEFTWAPWPFLMVSREAVEAVGLPRADFGFGGDDLEWTLRMSARFPALLVPKARGCHWPPPRPRGPEAYDIDCLQLHNLCVLSAHLPHGRRARRHLPGGFWRLARKWGATPATVADMCRAAWSGLICGRPARANGGSLFWRRFLMHRRS